MKIVVFLFVAYLCLSANSSYSLSGFDSKVGGFKESKSYPGKPQNREPKKVYSKSGKANKFPNKTQSIRISTPNGEISEQTRFVNKGRNITAVKESRFTQGQTSISIIETTNFKQPRKRKHKR